MFSPKLNNQIKYVTLSQDLQIISNKIYQLLNTVDTSAMINKSVLNLFHVSGKFKLKRSEIALCLLVSRQSSIDTLVDDSTGFLEHNEILNYCVILELLNLATKIHSLVPFELKHNNKKNNLNLSVFSYKTNVSQLILIGDYLFTIAFEQIAEMNNGDILQQFSSTAKSLVINEAVLNAYQPNLDNNPNLQLEILHLISIIKNKYSPLYHQIIYLLNNQHKTQSPWIAVLLNNMNTFFVIKKLINKTITLNPSVTHLLYSQSIINSEVNIILHTLLKTAFGDISKVVRNIQDSNKLSPTYNMNIIKNLISSLFAQPLQENIY